MEKEKGLFNETYFDKQVYDNEVRRYKDMADQFPVMLNVLKDNALPTNYEFTIEITKADDAFERWVRTQEKIRLTSDAFLPPKERQRVTDIYNDLFDDCRHAVGKIGSFLTAELPIVPDGDGVAVDKSAIEALCRSKATKRINTSLAEKYYYKIKKVSDALGELRDFLTENNLPDISVTQNVPHFPAGLPPQFIRQNVLEDMLSEGLTPQNFMERTRGYFTTTE